MFNTLNNALLKISRKRKDKKKKNAEKVKAKIDS